MKWLKVLSLTIIAFFLFGCPTIVDKYKLKDLERRVIELESSIKVSYDLEAQIAIINDKLILIGITLEELKAYDLRQITRMAEEAGASKFWWRSSLTGASNSLASINHSNLTDGDGGIVITISGTTANGYLYVWDADGTNSDDPTSCTSDCRRIATDSGTGAWQLVNWYSGSIKSTADDGDVYINFSNSGAESYTESDGDSYIRRDYDVQFIEDSTDGWLAQTTMRLISTGSNPYTLNAKYCWGGTVNYTASGGEIDLPAVEQGMRCRIKVDSQSVITIDPNGTEIIRVNGLNKGAGASITNVDGATNEIGDTVDLEYYAAGIWLAIEVRGDWD